MNYLNDDEIKSIERKYGNKIEDILLRQKFDNYEKSISWKSVKNNNKTNKFKKKQDTHIHNTDPYKFLQIPKNIREIIVKLCQKNNISLQTLAIKINIPLHTINCYIHENYFLDNYYLHKILSYFEFDLIEYVKNDQN